MDYPIDNIPGFEGRKVTLRPAGFVSGVRLFVDGERVKPKWGGKYILRSNNGTEVEALLRSNFIDPIPQLVVYGQVYHAVEPLAWYELGWSGLPVLLIFGGALGAFCGIIAAYSNTRIFRTDLHPVLKYLTTGLVSAVAVAVYFILGMIFAILIQGVQ